MSVPDDGADHAPRPQRPPGRVRPLRPEEGLLVIGFVASALVTIYANLDLARRGIDSRKIEGGLLRLAVVVALAALLPWLSRALQRPRSHGRSGVSAPFWGYAAPRLGSVCRASMTAFGFLAATRSKAKAGPSGVRRPCSQFRSVATLTPIMSANSAWDARSLDRTACTSVGRKVIVLDARRVPRRIWPACRTLVSSSRNAPSFI